MLFAYFSNSFHTDPTRVASQLFFESFPFWYPRNIFYASSLCFVPSIAVNLISLWRRQLNCENINITAESKKLRNSLLPCSILSASHGRPQTNIVKSAIQLWFRLQFVERLLKRVCCCCVFVIWLSDDDDGVAVKILRFVFSKLSSGMNFYRQHYFV